MEPTDFVYAIFGGAAMGLLVYITQTVTAIHKQLDRMNNG